MKTLKLLAIPALCATLVACGGGGGGGGSIAPIGGVVGQSLVTNGTFRLINGVWVDTAATPTPEPVVVTPVAPEPVVVTPPVTDPVPDPVVVPPPPPPPPPPTLDQVKASAGIYSLGGKQTVVFEGETRYFFNGVEVAPPGAAGATSFANTSAAQYELNTVRGRFGSRIVLGTPTQTSTGLTITNAITREADIGLTITKDALGAYNQQTPGSVNWGQLVFTPFNDDVAIAWSEGYRGQHSNGPAAGTEINNVGVLFSTAQRTSGTAERAEAVNAMFTLVQRVAPNITSEDSVRFSVLISLANQYEAIPANARLGIDYNHLRSDGLLVGSMNYLLSAPADVQASYSAANLLPVKPGAGANFEYGVLGTSNVAEAASVAGGYAALVMSKFAGLSGSQAGTLLKGTAVDNQAGGRDLSLRRALSPTGNLR